MELCGGGLARQLADKYEGLEDDYNNCCKEHNYDWKKLHGNVFQFSTTKDKKSIMNIFSQDPGFSTDYGVMQKCFRIVKRIAEEMDWSIAIPYKIGCGIAYGDWETVKEIIEEVFKDYDVTIYKLPELIEHEK